MTRGVNPDAIETIEIRDTADHYSTVMDIRTIGKAFCKIVNTLNQDVTVTLQGTTFDDPDADNPVDLGENLTVGMYTTKFVSTSAPFSYLRVKAVASVAPDSGELTLVWEFKHGRD